MKHKHNKHLQRIVLTWFVVTFACARLLVLLIMSRDIPDLYVHFGGTHIHHLNYGIFILSIVGAVLLFHPPSGKVLDFIAVAYGVGLALTFDEFGMWLHLGGSYWQRASFDAIIVLAALLALLAYMPPLGNWHRPQVAIAVVAVGGAALFFIMLIESFHFAESVEPQLEQLEQHGPL